MVIHNGREEEGWLDEGMSIVAEELGAKYYETKFPPPTGRTNPAQLFPDSAQGFVSGFLEDSYAYLLRPDTASITLHSDADDGLEWRGGDWLLLHWLGDQKGTPIYTALEQSNLTGIANIAASAGASFPSVFGNFSLSLWTDSIVGESRSAVPSQDRFATRNLRQIYQRLFDTSGGSPYYPRPYPVLPAVLPSSGLLTGRIVPGSMAYYILDTTGRSGVVTLEFAPTTGTSFLSTLNAQVSVYRLP